MGTSAGLYGVVPHPLGAGPGANREAVFLLTGKQAPSVYSRTDGASDEEPGASKSACVSQPPATVPVQPFLGGRPGGCANGWGHQGA